MSTKLKWRKSTRSNTQSACVELAVELARTSVRDTKARDGGTLTFAADAFGAFLAGVKGR